MPSINTKWVAGVAMLASVAYAMSVMRLHLPYPILPFLSFDFSEVADLLAYFFFGLKGGLVATFAHWIALNMGTPFHRLIGPTMKLLAVLSMMVGIELARRLAKNYSPARELIGGEVFRVGLMAVVTFFLYYVLFPEVYLPFASNQLSRLGLSFNEPLSLVSVMVALNAVFNAIHVPISYLPAIGVHRAVTKALPYFSKRPSIS